MTKKGYAVIGANFGDEGKGLMTDYLASKLEDVIVVRHNGGSQAGHTVQNPEGDRHVFSHFASGTLAGAATYLADDFIINPIQFRIEYEKLEKMNFHPEVFLTGACKVTTPYDMLINQVKELLAGNKKHGSCGIGINETITRHHSHSLFMLTAWDLEKNFDNQLSAIKNFHVPARFFELDIKRSDIPKKWLDLLDSTDLINRYKEDVEFFLSKVQISSNYPKHFKNIIFEGAQGLLLDEDHKFFPHVTRSKTGMDNIATLCARWGIKEIDVTYMTRSYLTRHGAGPLPNELWSVNWAVKPYKKVEDLTNVPNPWQGSLRYAYLNVNLLKESISNDLKGHGDLKINAGLAVTCMDQIDEGRIKYIEDDQVKDIFVGTTESKWFTRILSDKVGIPVTHLSYGPTRNNVMEVEDGIGT